LVDIDMRHNNKVKDLTLQVITDQRSGHFVIDDGNINYTVASLTLFNPDSKRIIPNTTKEVLPPMEIRGVGGKPFQVTKKCSAYICYTDVDGERHTFVLPNVYIYSAVCVPQTDLFPCHTWLAIIVSNLHPCQSGWADPAARELDPADIWRSKWSWGATTVAERGDAWAPVHHRPAGRHVNYRAGCHTSSSPLAVSTMAASDGAHVVEDGDDERVRQVGGGLAAAYR
jgi:hypothetical protein